MAQGWGEKYQERVRAKNKLTAHERCAKTADDEASILPINTFVNVGLYFGDEGSKKNSPNAGVITAFVRIEKRWTIGNCKRQYGCVWIMVA